MDRIGDSVKNSRRPRMIALPDFDVMVRWWKFVWRGPETECWIWTGARTSLGYGRFWMEGCGSAYLAHRVGYRWFVGVIEAGQVVLHRCDNPGCVNPMHLEVGSYQGNTWNMIEKGRHRGSVEVVNECPY